MTLVCQCINMLKQLFNCTNSRRDTSTFTQMSYIQYASNTWPSTNLRCINLLLPPPWLITLTYILSVPFFLINALSLQTPNSPHNLNVHSTRSSLIQIQTPPTSNHILMIPQHHTHPTTQPPTIPSPPLIHTPDINMPPMKHTTITSPYTPKTNLNHPIHQIKIKKNTDIWFIVVSPMLFPNILFFHVSFSIAIKFKSSYHFTFPKLNMEGYCNMSL